MTIFRFWSVLFISLWVVCLSHIAHAQNELTKPPREHEKFEILYYEVLPAMVLESKTDDLGQQDTEKSLWTWSFESFGRSFHLSLESNDRLIAKLPSSQRDKVLDSYQLYRGKIDGIENSWIRLTRIGEKWSGMMWDGQDVYIIDPMSVIEPALPGLSLTQSSAHGMYRLSDTRELELRVCGSGVGGIHANPLNAYDGLVQELQERVTANAAGATLNLDMAVVADVEFSATQQNIFNTPTNAAVIARINVVDGIFSEQVGVQINLVEIQELSDNGSLTSTDPLTLLQQFGALTSSSTFDHPGVAHLFTGRDLDENTIGIAYIDSLCDSEFGIGVNEVTGGGMARALVVAHELGHNFGAPHDNEDGSACSSTPGTFLMSPTVNGSDEFSECSLNQIEPVLNVASCIDVISLTQSDLRVDFPDNPFESVLGSLFSVAITIHNDGPGMADNATASVTVPVQLSVQSATIDSGSCTNNGGGQVTCDLGNVPNAGGRTITLTLQGQTAGEFVGSVTVSADNDQNTANNTDAANITIVAGPPPPPPLPGFTSFTAAHSNKCLEIPNNSQENLVGAIQSDCDGGDNQQFQLQSVGSDMFQLIAQHSGKCLDIAGASTADRARVIQYTCHNGNNQRFLLTSSPSTLVAVHSGKCVDVFGGVTSTSNGATVVQWACHGNANQQWAWATGGSPSGPPPPPPGPPPPPPPLPGFTSFTAAHSNKCLEIPNNSQENLIGAIQSDCDSGDNQQFQLQSVGSDMFRLIAKHSGKCLDINRASIANGARVIQYTCHNDDNQRFLLTSSPSTLVAVHSGKCVDVFGGVTSTSNGATVVQWACHGNANQQWAFTEGAAVEERRSGP